MPPRAVSRRLGSAATADPWFRWPRPHTRDQWPATVEPSARCRAARPPGRRRKAAPPGRHCSTLSPRLCAARPGTTCSQGSSQPSLVPLARMCQKPYWFESTEEWPPSCVEVGGGGGQGGSCLPAAVRNSHCSPPPLRPGRKLTTALDAGLLKVRSEPGAAGTARSLPRTGSRSNGEVSTPVPPLPWLPGAGAPRERGSGGHRATPGCRLGRAPRAGARRGRGCRGEGTCSGSRGAGTGCRCRVAAVRGGPEGGRRAGAGGRHLLAQRRPSSLRRGSGARKPGSSSRSCVGGASSASRGASLSAEPTGWGRWAEVTGPASGPQLASAPLGEAWTHLPPGEQRWRPPGGGEQGPRWRDVTPPPPRGSRGLAGLALLGLLRRGADWAGAFTRTLGFCNFVLSLVAPRLSRRLKTHGSRAAWSPSFPSARGLPPAGVGTHRGRATLQSAGQRGPCPRGLGWRWPSGSVSSPRAAVGASRFTAGLEGASAGETKAETVACGPCCWWRPDVSL